MASEDEMAGYSSMDEMAGYSSMSDDDFGDVIGDTDTNLSEPIDYTILDASEIKSRQDEIISQVSATLYLTTDQSCVLLHHYNWDRNTAQEAWCIDESNVRIATGLLEPVAAVPTKSKEHTCGICFDNYDPDSMEAAACGHLYCAECWEGYIISTINEGPACLALRCPDPSCIMAIGRSMVQKLVEAQDLQRYTNYLLRSYVEQSRRIKWCPSPDCAFSVVMESGSEIYDVRCKCLHSFCWKCTEDSHRPVDCKTVAKWIAKNSSEAENTQWILSYTKPCPKCKKPIEKNHGCNHMSCRQPCNHQFCWICLGPWEQHGGDNYNCNRYSAGEDSEEKLIRSRAKESLQRYTHYYERWASNNQSRRKALEDLRNLQGEKLEDLVTKLGLKSTMDVQFILDAWMQIAECRRILQWSYTYGYYHMDGKDKHKKEYFEFAQGLAEWALEQLHDCAEQEGKTYFENKEKEGKTDFEIKGLIEDFKKYEKKLINYTGVMRKYFDGLVRTLEKGMDDIGFAQLENNVSKYGHDEAETSTQEVMQWWECNLCTYVNELSETICHACNACNQCTYINHNSVGYCEVCGDEN